jgi:ABC-type antimicrobial peptide transport system permease subunit
LAKGIWHSSSSIFEDSNVGIQDYIIHEEPGLAAMKLQPNVLDLQWEFTWLTGRSLRQGLLILFAVVIFVLLIACVNVANLLLGRAVKRQKELSLRAAIGVSRSQLIRQLLTESFVLSLGEHVWEYSLRFSAYGMWARKKRPRFRLAILFPSIGRY